jgi:hypothetical protein
MNRSGRHDQCQTPAVELGRIASRDDLSLLTTGKKMETSVINQLIDRFVRRHGACGSKPSAGKQALRDASAEGYEIIKIYNKLDLLTITAIMARRTTAYASSWSYPSARQKGSPRSSFPGFGMVAHSEECAADSASAVASAVASATTTQRDLRLQKDGLAECFCQPLGCESLFDLEGYATSQTN